ncbi:hypothetical protein HMPREF9098_1598 [Kingella denitrificans ATCC 33394]|uniref:Uncharacterized protein n=1 Tax=Kingella denitrificans ATCC 33394 TaxID=888741 RepID=F0F0G3_9NEIS|nr:hypothetical protein HMPREF9098_1598 [Kingella denitrificans ATCC 33394]
MIIFTAEKVQAAFYPTKSSLHITKTATLKDGCFKHRKITL